MGGRLAGALQGGQYQSTAVVLENPPATVGRWASMKEEDTDTDMMHHQEKMP